jgi:hypothetical protein
MPDQRPLVEKVLDLAIYAPVGLACWLGSDLPQRVAARRTQIEDRVRVARWVGEMAVNYSKLQLEQRMASTAVPSGAAPEAEVVHVPVHHAQPFEGYDTLAATQIVQLLGRLPHTELHLVRDYEATGRGRRTILAKIDQLLAT